MKSLAQFSIKNSLLILVLTILIVVSGVYTLFFQLNREAFPNVNFDVVTITTTYPGSTPPEVERLITIPIEKELKEIDDIKEISSVSAESISNITVIIEEDADNKMAIVNDIQRAVDRVEDLPDDLPENPLVQEMKTKNNPIIEISLSGPMSEKALREHALNLEDKFLDLPDVSKVTRKGYRDQEIWVEILPDSLKKYHVSLNEIQQALQTQNQAIPAGKFFKEKEEYILRTTGEFENAEDVRKTIIRAGPLGEWIRVDDVATVSEQFEERDLIEKTRGSLAIRLIVVKKESGDAIDMVEDVKNIVADYQKIAPDLKVDYVNDLSFYIERRLNILKNNGIIGLAMVTVSLFIFLSFGTALSAFIGIPTALLMAFAIMGYINISINLISLFGLIMVLGMLVDEDIVIAENIHRHLEEGLSPEEAAVKGNKEVGKAVVATVLTTIAAFLPLFFMGGIMGKFIRDIPKVVTLTLLASLLEALVILPSHISDISKIMHNLKKKNPKKSVQKTKGFFEKLKHFYLKTLSHSLKHRYLYTVALLVVFLSSIFIATNFMQFLLFPAKGIEIFFIRVEGQIGDSLEDTAEKMKQLEKIVDTLPKNELDTYTTLVGMVQNDPNDPFTNRASHVGQIQVFLTPEPQRDRSSQEISNSLRSLAKEVKGFEKVSFDQFRTGPPVGKPVQVRILGEDFNTLEKIAEEYKTALTKIEGVTDIRDDYEVGKTEKRVEINQVRAAQAGLDVQTIAMTVRQAFEGVKATSIQKTEEEIDIVVKFPPRFRHQQTALANLLVPNPQGHLIPLSAVATFTETKGVQAIKHFDGDRNLNVTANVDEKITSPVEVMEKLKVALPHIETRYPGYRVHFAGEAEDTQESLRDLRNTFFIAAGLILIILITMFKSFLQSFIVLFTIPFSLIGVVLSFLAHGLPLSFMALLGVIGLTGIVVDGAIILIDFINNYHAKGHNLHSAILKGANVRFRAVLLTSITTVLGVLPASYGLGGKDPFIEPMALALNYGIIFSAILTLYYVPIFLAILGDLKKLPFLNRFKTPYEIEHDLNQPTQ